MIGTQVLKHLPCARKGKRGGSKVNVKGEATATEAMDESGCVRIIEREKVRRDDPIECFLSMKVGGYF